MVVNLWLSARLATSFILARHFFGNSAPPTARTSSTIKIWFALLPVCKALRACLRQPISACPAPRFRLQMRCDGESEPDVHPRAIQVDSLAPTHLTLRAALRQSPERLPRRLGHRRVDIPRAPGKLDNLIELPRDLVHALPSHEALRACLRHPISPPPSDSVRPYAFPKSPR